MSSMDILHMTCRSNCPDSEPFSTELGPNLYRQKVAAVHFQMGCNETVYIRKSISVPRPEASSWTRVQSIFTTSPHHACEQEL